MPSLKFRSILIFLFIFNFFQNCQPFSIKNIIQWNPEKPDSNPKLPSNLVPDVIIDKSRHDSKVSKIFSNKIRSSSTKCELSGGCMEMAPNPLSGQIPGSIMRPIESPRVPRSPVVPSLQPFPVSPVSPPLQPIGVKAAYWPAFDGFPAILIDTSYFTHIYYAFLLPEPETFKLNITPFDQTKLSEFRSAIRSKNPPVKTILSIGGGGNNSTVFSEMVSAYKSRAAFISSTIATARAYDFDGVDLDWEFPADDLDMSNLAILYSEWSTALTSEATVTSRRRLLLTSAVHYSPVLTDGDTRMYPIETINHHVDWINPMCFDYHGKWENVTGAPAALYGNISTSGGIGAWIESGLDPIKLVMGLPLYGHSWTLQDPNVNSIGAPAVGVGPGGGLLTYSQIVDFNSGKLAVSRFDSGTVSYYSYLNDSWVGYDDTASIQLKVVFAKMHGLGGYFFWALGQDRDWALSKLGKLPKYHHFAFYKFE